MMRFAAQVLFIGLILSLNQALAASTMGALYNAELVDQSRLSDPARLGGSGDNEWLVFNIPALPGTRSPCCWKGKTIGLTNLMGEAGCTLGPVHESYGTDSESPFTENLMVYGRLVEGRLHQIQVVGEHCPVDGAGEQVNWLGDVDTTAGLDWLEAAARNGNNTSANSSALYALALHADGDAGERLFSLASEQDNHISEEAVFWLGEARGEQGFEMLQRLLVDLPRGECRRAVNFGLARNSSPQAVQVLMEIARSDPDRDQRGDALFWLAVEHPALARPLLLKSLTTEQDKAVLEQAVFAISQLSDNHGDQLLFELAKNPRMPRSVRRQALFWLAQSENENSLAELTELLSQ